MCELFLFESFIGNTSVLQNKVHKFNYRAHSRTGFSIHSLNAKMPVDR